MSEYEERRNNMSKLFFNIAEFDIFANTVIWGAEYER